jgi:hypothetical protein
VPGLFGGLTRGWLLRVAVAAAATLLLGEAMEHALPAPDGLGHTLAYLAVGGGGLGAVYLALITLLRLPETEPLMARASRLLAGRT